MNKKAAAGIISVLLILAIVFGALYFTNNAKLSADVADKAAQIETLTADAADKAAEIETLTADAADKAARIEALDADAAEKAARIEALDADAADKAAQIETLNADTAEKAVQIENLVAEVMEKTAQIEALQADLADKDARIETLKADLVDKAARIEALQADVADKAAQIEALTAASAEPAEPETAEEPGVLLATVNGEEIREGGRDLRIWTRYVMTQVGSDPDEATLQQVNRYAMENTIRYVALKQNMEKMGYSFSAEEVDAAVAQAGQEWDNAVNSIMAQLYPVAADATEEEKAAALEKADAYLRSSSGYTRESYTEEAEMNLVYTKAREMIARDVALTDAEIEAYFNGKAAEDGEQLRSAAMQQFETAGTTPTEEEISAAVVQLYEMYKNYYGYDFKYMPEGYRGITHILLDVDDQLLNNWKDVKNKLEQGAEGVTQEMLDAAEQAVLDSVKNKTDEIRAKLDAGESFDALILEYGTDPGMQDDATRAAGYPVHAASMIYDKDFTGGAMALENVGDVSEPLVSQFGVHILCYLRDIPGGAVELTDDMRNSLRDDLSSDRISSAFNDLMERLSAEADVVWTEAGEAWKLTEEEKQ